MIELLQKGLSGRLVRPRKHVHDVVRQFPYVETLLIFLSAFEEEHVDGASIRNVPIVLELLANGMPHIGG